MNLDETSAHIQSRMKELKRRLEGRDMTSDLWRAFDAYEAFAEKVAEALDQLSHNFATLDELAEVLDPIH